MASLAKKIPKPLSVSVLALLTAQRATGLFGSLKREESREE